MKAEGLAFGEFATYEDARARYAPSWRLDPSFKPWRPSALTWETATPQQKKALRAKWAKGDLRYKLDPEQRRAYDAFHRWYRKNTGRKRGQRSKRFIFDVSRRWGKTSLAFLLAVEMRIKNRRNKRCAYWTDTGRMVEEIVLLEIVPWMFDDCPPEARPEWFPSKHRLIWHRDHKNLDMCRALELAGLDDPNRARGRSLFFGVVDEAAFIPSLEYIDRSVLGRQMQTVPEGCIIYASTPPVSPTHYFTATLREQAVAKGEFITGTIFSNPRLSDEEIELEIEETGGLNHSTTKRELYCEHTSDETMMVLPEAHRALNEGILLYTAEKLPGYRNCYTSMDPGWGDATGVLFGFIDYRAQCLVVEAEWVAQQAPSSVVAGAIKSKEDELWRRVLRWTPEGGFRSNPHRRWSDTDKRLVADLETDHGLTFGFTLKDNLAQQITLVRDMILCGQLKVIRKNCPQLLMQMTSAVYKNENRNAFARQDQFSHFDLVAALIYLCRNAAPLFRKNPFPPEYDSPADRFIPTTTQESDVKRTQTQQRIHEHAARHGARRSTIRKRGFFA